MSDAIAFLALGVSLAGLIVGEMRHRENIRMARRPINMKAYEIVYEFADFVAKYKTMYHLDPGVGTRELVASIEEFKKALNSLGPVTVPGLADLADEFKRRAWQLQRAMDRWIAEERESGAPTPHNAREEEASEICQWFHQRKATIKGIFHEHL